MYYQNNRHLTCIYEVQMWGTKHVWTAVKNSDYTNMYVSKLSLQTENFHRKEKSYFKTAEGATLLRIKAETNLISRNELNRKQTEWSAKHVVDFKLFHFNCN